MHLRIKDFKSLSDYNSTLLRITSIIDFRGDKLIDAKKI